MNYEKVYQEDGSYLIRQIRDDGRIRLVDADYHGYVDWITEGKEVADVPYVAPPPPPEPEPVPVVELTTMQKLERTDHELNSLIARTLEDIINDRIADGKFVAQSVKDKIAEREALRNELTAD